jgi:hypothetical protein
MIMMGTTLIEAGVLLQAVQGSTNSLSMAWIWSTTILMKVCKSSTIVPSFCLALTFPDNPSEEILTRTRERAVDGVKVTLFVYVCACFSALSSLLLGYDIGIMSSAILFIRPDLGLSTVQAEV